MCRGGRSTTASTTRTRGPTRTRPSSGKVDGWIYSWVVDGSLSLSISLYLSPPPPPPSLSLWIDRGGGGPDPARSRMLPPSSGKVDGYIAGLKVDLFPALYLPTDGLGSLSDAPSLRSLSPGRRSIEIDGEAGRVYPSLHVLV